MDKERSRNVGVYSQPKLERSRVMATVSGKVTEIERVGYTASGNPKMFVTLDNGQRYRVKNDAAISFRIENGEYRRQTHTFQLSQDNQIEMDL